MADDSSLSAGGITGICVVLLGGIGFGLKWIGEKVWLLLMKQINARIDKMDKRIEDLEEQLLQSKERECRFWDCPEGRPCAKIVRSFTLENADQIHLNPDRFLYPSVSGDDSVVIHKKGKS